MAVTTIEQLAHAMKYVYLDPLIKTIDESSGPILAALEKNNKQLEGDKFVFAAQYGRNGGIGARGENDDLPEANPRSVRRGLGTQRNIYARISFTEKFMHQVSSNKGSFIEGVTAQMDDLTMDAKDYMRRNIMTDHTGVMAKSTAGATSTDTIPLDAGTVMNQFYAGQVIDIFTSNVGFTTQVKSVDGKRIKDVDKAGRKLILAENVTVPANSYVSIHNTFNQELTGLTEIMTPDNTIYEINRAQNKWFNPQVYAKGSVGTPAAFDSMFIQEAIDDIFDTIGVKPNFIAMNSATSRAYIEEQRTYKRNIDHKKVDGGVDLITYDNIPISKEKYMKDGEIFVINTKDFEIAQLADWGWMDKDGAILRAVANKAAYEATLTKYCELLCKRPSGQAVIKNLKVS